MDTSLQTQIKIITSFKKKKKSHKPIQFNKQYFFFFYIILFNKIFGVEKRERNKEKIKERRNEWIKKKRINFSYLSLY